MPLGTDSAANIEELGHRCKTEGGFGSIRGKSKAKCHQIAVAAGLNAACQKQHKRTKSRR